MGAVTMAQHTPGPWVLEDPLGPELLSIVVGDQPYDWLHVAQVSVTGNHNEGDLPKAQAKANARLIAAAPDLLEALREATDIIADQCKSRTGTVDRFLSAIAKAEGRS